MDETADRDSVRAAIRHRDRLDRAILTCLLTAPRASFRLIADVLDVSEQTVARRYRAMREEHVLHVTATINAEALGASTWLVRIRCRADGAHQVARALARRPDVGWVFLAGGATEVICALRSQRTFDRDHLLLSRLPASAQVLSVSAALTLHRFAGGPGAGGTDLGVVLTRTQRRALQDAAAHESVPVEADLAEADLDASDRRLVEQLVRDGRSTVVQLADVAGLTRATAARRLAALLAAHVVDIDVDLAPVGLGAHVQVQVWMALPPEHLERCGQLVARMPEVAFAAAVTGTHNLVASVVCASQEDIYRFVTTRLSRLDGLTAVELVPTTMVVKQASSLVDHDVLAT